MGIRAPEARADSSSRAKHEAQSMQRTHSKCRTGAEDWMLLRLQHQVAIAGDHITYGHKELCRAAACGAVHVLLIGQSAHFPEALVHEVLAHGGIVVRVPQWNAELN